MSRSKNQTAVDQTWLKELAGYLGQRKMSFAFWCLNPDSGDTGGILQDDWKTVNTNKVAPLQPAAGLDPNRFKILKKPTEGRADVFANPPRDASKLPLRTPPRRLGKREHARRRDEPRTAPRGYRPSGGRRAVTAVAA